MQFCVGQIWKSWTIQMMFSFCYNNQTSYLHGQLYSSFSFLAPFLLYITYSKIQNSLNLNHPGNLPALILLASHRWPNRSWELGQAWWPSLTWGDPPSATSTPDRRFPAKITFLNAQIQIYQAQVKSNDYLISGFYLRVYYLSIFLYVCRSTW